MEIWEKIFQKKIKEVATCEDPAHDYLHFMRVTKMAKLLCEVERGNKNVVVPAAWLHDLVLIKKDDPRRSLASKLSAGAARKFLQSINYPNEYIDEIAHAIESHSYSANITAKTLEAKIVQDADRLDGLGAIGLARCFATSGLLKREFYSKMDPFCKSRNPDDGRFTLDHFYQKLYKTAKSLQTEYGRTEGLRRLRVMEEYLENLHNEI